MVGRLTVTVLLARRVFLTVGGEARDLERHPVVSTARDRATDDCHSNDGAADNASQREFMANNRLVMAVERTDVLICTFEIDGGELHLHAALAAWIASAQSLTCSSLGRLAQAIVQSKHSFRLCAR